MKLSHSYSGAALWCVVLFALVPGLIAQETTDPAHVGVPQDWSQHHIVFSRDALAKHPELIYREPRILHQLMQRSQVRNSGLFEGADSTSTSEDQSGIHNDWNVTTIGGRLDANMFPAKFSFDPSTPPSCANDFVVFGLSVPGTTGGVANLIAFNNLYAGTGGLCPMGPSVMFAYNITTVTGGKVATSPVLSVDGKKVAFVESIPGAGASAIFHVLTWTAGQGALKTAAAPTMTSLTFSPTANSTTSSPWIDYSSDTAYLGADNGLLYKMTGVFHGTPTLANPPWPVTVSTNLKLTPPVLDSNLGLLMVGSANGTLYQINAGSGTIVASLPIGAKGKTGNGIIAAPIVDVTNGTTFAVSANGGTSAVLVEADTMASLHQLAKASLGLGASGGTLLSLQEPAFSNDYFTNPSSGLVRLCGTGPADTSPYQYAFGFSGRTMSTTNAFGFPVQILASTAARCTGWTEFFNPNVGVSPGTDFFFFGLTQDCTGSGSAFGCVEAIAVNNGVTTTTMATINGGPTGIVVDNYSTAGQASSIYFTADKINTAYKLTQNGLH